MIIKIIGYYMTVFLTIFRSIITFFEVLCSLRKNYDYYSHRSHSNSFQFIDSLNNSFQFLRKKWIIKLKWVLLKPILLTSLNFTLFTKSTYVEILDQNDKRVGIWGNHYYLSFDWSLDNRIPILTSLCMSANFAQGI